MVEENLENGKPPQSDSTGKETTTNSSRPEEQTDRLAEKPIEIPVVCLGGSAGALEAFEAFFDSMPADSGAAFVVIQHMSPIHKSLLPEILSHHTQMSVSQVRDGERLETNHVYITSANHHLGLRNGILFFTERIPEHGDAICMPIDFFLRCLSADCKERAVCILFSGAGSDGTIGARAVRDGGGLVITQDPQTAIFDSMPHNAVEAGLVDYVLPPERMAEAVVHYLQYYHIKAHGVVVSEAQRPPMDAQDVLTLVLEQAGHDFRCYKSATILRRIERRMGVLRILDMATYVALLRRDPDEVKQLLKNLLINVTSFLRDPEAFDEFRDKAIAPLVQSRTDNAPVRVWVPACSTGEEAYTLAILLLEQLAKVGKDCPLQVFATDLDEEALHIARTGFYAENVAADVGSERLMKFFVRKDNGYKVKDSLREVLTFATHNAITDPPFSKMDLISCRNLMIYLDSVAQTRLVELLNFSLKPGGYLLLGRSETIADQNDLFETISKKTRIYRRLSSSRPILPDYPILRKRRTKIPQDPVASRSMASNFADVVRLEILKHFRASAVLIDRAGDILQFHGQTGQYLKLPAAGPTFNVFKLAKAKLASKLRLAMRKTIQNGKTVVLDHVPIAHDEKGASVRLTVTPVSQITQGEPFWVVFFENVSDSSSVGAEVIQPPDNETAIKQLDDELQETHQDLQSTIEELQSSNKKLRTANEEVAVTNEELETTNQELTSSMEELQSTNEELTAAISQLQEKVILLDRANDDKANLIRATQVATIFLDKELRLKFCTSAMARLLSFTNSDLARPIADVLMGHLDCDLTDDLKLVVQNSSIVEKKVQFSDGVRYLMQAMPYYTQAGQADGVVITFNDITLLRQNQGSSDSHGGVLNPSRRRST